MIRRLLCWLGWHEWILVKKWRWWEQFDGWEHVGWEYKCKHCRKVKK